MKAYSSNNSKNWVSSFFIVFFIVASVVLGAIIGGHKKSYAIPAYARQLGVTCQQCHTIWPRLNAFGRKFKTKGYVDQSDNPGLPFALRILTNGQTTNTTPPGGPTTRSGVINFPSQVNGFIGTRLSPQVGVFSAFTATPTQNSGGGRNWVYSVDEQKYAYNFLPGKAVSLVVFHSTIFGFDPFPSLGNLAFEGDYTISPGIVNNGELLNPFDTTGFGLAAHGFLDKDNRYYGGVGIETAGAVPDTQGLGIGTNDTSHGGLDYVMRFAYTRKLGETGGTYNIGAAYFTGNQFPTFQLANSNFFTYRGHVNRLFVDGALQLPVHDNDLLEVVGLYGTGSDSNYFTPGAVSGTSGPFSSNVTGGFAQATYWWNRRIGLRATYDNSTVGTLKTTQWQAGPAWLPMEDLKINLNAGSSNSQGTNTTKYTFVLTKLF